MKKKYIIIILLLVLSLTGCTKYMQNDKNERIKYEATGQILPSNILCRPTDSKLLEIYEKNESSMTVKLSKLPECTEFKPSDIK